LKTDYELKRDFTDTQRPKPLVTYADKKVMMGIFRKYSTKIDAIRICCRNCGLYIVLPLLLYANFIQIKEANIKYIVQNSKKTKT
jgi:hypothetical protein